jgi:hypothetical protein
MMLSRCITARALIAGVAADDTHAARGVGDRLAAQESEEAREHAVAQPPGERHVAARPEARSERHVGPFRLNGVAQRGEEPRIARAVGIEKRDELAAAPAESLLDGRAVPPVPLEDDERDLRVARRVRLGDFHRAIGRSVADDHDLDVADAAFVADVRDCRETPRDGVADGFFFVERRDDYGQAGAGSVHVCRPYRRGPPGLRARTQYWAPSGTPCPSRSRGRKARSARGK